MTTVEEATHIVLDSLVTFKTVNVDLRQSGQRILAEDLVADRDFPPFERVTMDGIAIQFDTWHNGQRTFSIQETIGAGSPRGILRDTSHCIEIMTGAVLPENADTMIRYEDVQIIDGVATIQTEIKRGQNVHHQGEDRKAGSVIVQKGQLINAATIGVAATIGKSKIEVLEQPRVCLVSTGDELVPIDESPLPHQIRRSNVHAIAALLERKGVGCTILHLKDDQAEIQKSLATLLESHHAMVLSGGVSKGKFDFIPAALEAIGVEKQFHGVSQRPGKPFWFGTWRERSAVFALPGNPVSSFMSTLRYVIPWISKTQGFVNKPEFAVLNETFHFNRDLTYFLQVSLTSGRDGKLVAQPVPGRGSGDHANLVESDGFLELPQDKDVFEVGEVHQVWRYQ